MISPRRIVAAACLAAGVTGLAAPTASAAGAGAQDKALLNPVGVLDSLVMSDIPAEHKDAIPRPSAQLTQLNRLNDLNQLEQLIAPVAPVLNLVPAVH